MNITKPFTCVRPTKDIKDLKPGQKGWTHAWAMLEDIAGKLWIRAGYSVYDDEVERVSMHVEKEQDGSITVDASHINSGEWGMLVIPQEDITRNPQNFIPANVVSR